MSQLHHLIATRSQSREGLRVRGGDGLGAGGGLASGGLAETLHRMRARRAIDHPATWWLGSLSLPHALALLCSLLQSEASEAANPVEKIARKPLQRQRLTDYPLFLV